MTWPVDQGRLSDTTFKSCSFSTSQEARAAAIGHAHQLRTGTHKEVISREAKGPASLLVMGHHNVPSTSQVFHTINKQLGWMDPRVLACDRAASNPCSGSYPLSEVKMTSVSPSRPRSPTAVIKAPTAPSSSIKESPNGPRPERLVKLCPLN